MEPCAYRQNQLVVSAGGNQCHHCSSAEASEAGQRPGQRQSEGNGHVSTV